MRLSELKGKKIAIWGAGREGLSMLRLLHDHLPETSADLLDESGKTDQAKLSAEYPALAQLICSVSEKTLEHYDIIIKSPGISLYRPEILAAQTAGVVFTSVTNIWFAEHPHAKTICVTGTKGKSTTTSMIAHLLKAQGLKVQLAGNIGVPLADVWQPKVSPDIWVIELSSYQTSDFTGKPSIAVLLNLYPEHLDWHQNVEHYYNDKLNLLMQLDEQGYLVTNPNVLDQAQVAQFKAPVFIANKNTSLHQQQGVFFDGDYCLFGSQHFSILGPQNLANACVALTVLKILGFDPVSAETALRSFQPLPHRLQIVGKINSVLYINDSISTTPESTIAALKAFPKQAVTLLLGGYDRGLDYTVLADYLQAHPVHTVIVLPDNGERILSCLQKTPSPVSNHSFSVDTLHQALALARRHTPYDGIVLLSPAAPSYGRFVNYEARGRLFTEIALSN